MYDCSCLQNKCAEESKGLTENAGRENDGPKMTAGREMEC